MVRYGMVVDLRKCIGCYACVISCKQEHFFPPGVYGARVLVWESGKFPMSNKEILPLLCNHCQESICVKVCPTGASIKREDGIVIVDKDKCMGCRYCVIACPYQSRSYYADGKKEYFPGQGLTKWEAIGQELSGLQPGTVVKCDFCVDRIEKGIKMGLKPGIDREATPVCVLNCMAGARYFGDLEDPESEVSRLVVRERHGKQLHPEFGTDPSVYYLS